MRIIKISKFSNIVLALALILVGFVCPLKAGAADLGLAVENTPDSIDTQSVIYADIPLVTEATDVDIADSNTSDSIDIKSVDYAGIPLTIDGYPVPKEIAGYQVIFVEWSGNSLYLPPGIVRLTLRANSDNPEVSRRDQALFDAIGKLPEGWMVGVTGGAGFSFDRMLAEHEKLNEDFRKQGTLTRSGGPLPDAPTASSPQVAETEVVMVPGPARSVALDQNGDPLIKDLYMQGVELKAPTVGTYQGQYSFFSMQVQTNSDGFLQAGLLFDNDDQGKVRWTTERILNYFLMPFSPNMPYTHDHIYRFAIYNQWPHNAANWAIEAMDCTFWTWTQQLVTWEPGTKLKYSWNTSVWFENMNTNWWWYWDFTNPIWAVFAEEEDYWGQVLKWSSDTKTVYIVHPNGSWETKPNNGIMTGSLANGGYTYWYLNKVLLAPTS